MELAPLIKRFLNNFAASAAQFYLKSYAGLEYLFFRRNHIVAFEIEGVRINLRDRWSPPSEVREHIERSFRERPPKYDGLSLKLHSFSYNITSCVLTLDVSYGKYSQYLFTNLDGGFRRRFPSPKYWFNALNIGALVVTSDNKIRLHRRPYDSIQSPGKIDTACGHPTGMREVGEDRFIESVLGTIIKKEVGAEVKIKDYYPLVAFMAHPNNDFNLMYIAHIAETSRELKSYAGLADEDHLYFVDASVDSITKFLKSKHPELSRSVPETLLHYIRRQRLGRA